MKNIVTICFTDMIGTMASLTGQPHRRPKLRSSRQSREAGC